MAHEKTSGKIDWSSLWKKEDWWAVWVGFFILLLGIAGWLPPLPSFAKWTTVTESFPAGVGTIWTVILLFIFVLVLSLIANIFIGTNVRRYLAGFAVVFGLGFVAFWIGKYSPFANWGLSTVLWALILGLIISNVRGIPDWLKAAARTKFFIKIGLDVFNGSI